MYPIHVYEDIQALSNRKFSSWILIPEITTQLIEEDMQLTMEEAMKVLEESFDFGNTLFADVDEDELEDWLAQRNEASMKGKEKEVTGDKWVSLD